MKLVGYKIIDSFNLESTGRVDSSWRANERGYKVDFVSKGKIFPSTTSIKKHLTNVLVKKVSMSDWKLIEVYEAEGPTLDSLIDERMMMKVLKA